MGDWLNQQSFDVRDQVVDRLMMAMDDFKGSSSRIAEVLNKYAELVHDVGDPNQASMFGDANPSKLKLIEVAHEAVRQRIAADAAAKAAKKQGHGPFAPGSGGDAGAAYAGEGRSTGRTEGSRGAEGPVATSSERYALRSGEGLDSRIGRAEVQKAFGGKAEVSELEDGTYRVIRNGFEVIVHPNLDYIEINPETVRRDYGRDPLPGEQAVGRYVRIDQAGLIQLAKRGGDGAILDHEVFHAAMDLALTPSEKAGVLKRYGTEEAAAEAYSAMKANAPAGTYFAKIRAFFQRILDAVTGRGNAAEGTLRKIARGDVWEQGSTPDNIKAMKPVARGAFGPVYTQFTGDATGALQKLLYERQGEAVGALDLPIVGRVSLPYSTARKIIDYHPEAAPNLQGFLVGLSEVVREGPNRIDLRDPQTGRRAVIRKDMDGLRDRWLLTAYGEEAGRAAPLPEGTTGGSRSAPFDGSWDRPDALSSGASNQSVAEGEPIVKGADPTERYAMRSEPLGLFEPEPPKEGPRLADAAEEPKRRLVISPNADESFIKLVEKSGLSEDGKMGLIDSISQHLKDNPERRVMSDAEYRDLANKVDPGNIWALDPTKITRDNLPAREVLAERPACGRVLPQAANRAGAKTNTKATTGRDERVAFQRETALDTNGSLIGFGYAGSSSSANRNIQQVSFGFNQTVWSNPLFGNFRMMTQFSNLTRSQWWVAPGRPRSAPVNMVFIGLRYELP